jgi:SAM-dependent methyltransferase
MTRIANDPQAAIDFDSELSRGFDAYEDKLGDWWLSRARDPAHSRAYRRIAEFLRVSFKHPPRLVVDYGCGSGELLLRLGVSFPKARLVGLDGSDYLLGLARRRLARRGGGSAMRTNLLRTPLPFLETPVTAADLALFVFPNLLQIVGTRDRDGHLRRWSTEQNELAPSELAIARSLSRAIDADAGDSGDGEETTRALLLQARLVSRNLRGLLRRGGHCARVEYGRARRHELSEIDMRMDRRLPPQWFRVLASSYFRSRVIEDVDQQAGNLNGGPGGYLITILQAI